MTDLSQFEPYCYKGMIIRRALPCDMDAVYRLTYEEYLSLGYVQRRDDKMLRHYPHIDGIPETIVLVATKNDEIIGTISVTKDGPAKLHTDVDFPRETEIVRRACRESGDNLAASWRIVTKAEERASQDMVSCLISAALRVALDTIDVVLFTFNPKHERIYTRLLGLETLARGDCQLDQNTAPPGVLMYARIDTILEHWKAYCKRKCVPF